MTDQTILIKKQLDHRLDLTLNRPKRRNALSRELVDTLRQALLEADADDQVRVICLSASGEQAFCAGGDLADGPGEGGVAGSARAYGDLIETMDSLGTPLIAKVQGHCMGGGVGLMLGCDMAVAAKEVKIGTPEVRSGVFPMMIAPLIIRHAGPKRAMEMFLTGQRISAQEALDWGLLNRVVPAQHLDWTVDELCSQVLAGSPTAQSLGRKALAQTRHLPLAQATPILAQELLRVLSTEDAMEGIAAFLGKRKPEWKGR